jgi:CubicO group peptidase (beta-lactamase class C family)
VNRVVATIGLLSVVTACGAAPRVAPARAARPPTAALPVPASDLASWIDAYAGGFGREWGPAFAPSGYLVVAKDGAPIVSRAYGKANPRTRATLGPSTRFQIGSVTKQFTAVAVLQLAEKKRLKLTDSVRTHVAGLPPELEPVTLHHLLTHTSGIVNYTADPELMAVQKQHIPRSRVIESFAGKPLAFRPGEKFAYSNSNYFLLGLVIEKVTGKTYEEALQANVLGPAGMARSTTRYEPTAFDSAVGTTVDDHDQIRAVEPFDTPLPFAAGALRSTPIDMLAWDRALASGRLLGAEFEQRRITPEKDDYAYGVAVEMQDGHRVEAHSGGIDGFSSFFARVPDIGVAVVFVCNSDAFDAGAFGHAITKMIVSGKALPPKVERPIGVLDGARAAELSGPYALVPASREKVAAKLPKEILDSIVTMTLAASGGRIAVKANGQPPFVAFPAKDGNAFFTKTSGIELFPKTDAGTGHITGFRLEQHGLVLDYVRATPGT